jgi:hypothetical protein
MTPNARAPRPARLARALVLAALAGVALAPDGAAAQERLVGGLTWNVTPVLQQWSFAKPMAQDSLRVRGARQLVVPVSIATDVGRRLTLDVSTAYVRGEVVADAASGASAARRLDGPTDTKVRAVVRLVGDNVLVTAGANLPTGAVRLDDPQAEALRVLGAPALGLQAPVLGVGPGTTLGVVLAQRVGRWAVALASSVERRGAYTPLEASVAGVRAPTDLDPGEAIHVSLGVDGLSEGHRSSFFVTGTMFGQDRIDMTLPAGVHDRQRYRLGPSASATWRIQAASGRVQDVTFTLVGRYRARFQNAEGKRVAGSDSYAGDVSLGWLVGPSPRKGLVVGVEGHYQSGVAFDNTITTAAFHGGGATLGAVFPLGRATVQPYGRVVLGRFDRGGGKDNRTNGTGITLGLSVGGR